MNNFYFIILSLIILVYFIISIRKNKLSIKTSFLWVCSALVMLILSIFPYCLDGFANLIGVDYPPALFLTLCVVFLLIQNFSYSKNIATMQEKITTLAQEVSILKNDIGENKND